MDDDFTFHALKTLKQEDQSCAVNKRTKRRLNKLLLSLHYVVQHTGHIRTILFIFKPVILIKIAAAIGNLYSLSNQFNSAVV